MGGFDFSKSSLAIGHGSGTHWLKGDDVNTESALGNPLESPEGPSPAQKLSLDIWGLIFATIGPCTSPTSSCRITEFFYVPGTEQSP